MASLGGRFGRRELKVVKVFLCALFRVQTEIVVKVPKEGTF